MTKRAKIAAEHRDAKNPVNADPDKPSTGSKRGGKKKPWVIEYRCPRNIEKDKKVFWFWEHDGEWHEFFCSRYATKIGAEQAMAHAKRTWCRHNTETDPKEWRVRDTRVKETEEN